MQQISKQLPKLAVQSKRATYSMRRLSVVALTTGGTKMCITARYHSDTTR